MDGLVRNQPAGDRATRTRSEDPEVRRGLVAVGTGAHDLRLGPAAEGIDELEAIPARGDPQLDLPRAEFVRERSVHAREQFTDGRDGLLVDLVVLVEEDSEIDVDLDAGRTDHGEVGSRRVVVDGDPVTAIEVVEEGVGRDRTVDPAQVDVPRAARGLEDEVGEVVANEDAVAVVERGEKRRRGERVDLVAEQHAPGADSQDPEIGRRRAATLVGDLQRADATRFVDDLHAIRVERGDHLDARVVVDRVDDLLERRRLGQVDHRLVAGLVLDSDRAAIDARSTVEIRERDIAHEAAVAPFEGQLIETEGRLVAADEASRHLLAVGDELLDAKGVLAGIRLGRRGGGEDVLVRAGRQDGLEDLVEPERARRVAEREDSRIDVEKSGLRGVEGSDPLEDRDLRLRIDGEQLLDERDGVDAAHETDATGDAHADSSDAKGPRPSVIDDLGRATPLRAILSLDLLPPSGLVQALTTKMEQIGCPADQDAIEHRLGAGLGQGGHAVHGVELV